MNNALLSFQSQLQNSNSSKCVVDTLNNIFTTFFVAMGHYLSTNGNNGSSITSLWIKGGSPLCLSFWYKNHVTGSVPISIVNVTVHVSIIIEFLIFYSGLSWSLSYGSWMYNYLCNQCLSPLTLWVRIPLRRGVLDTTLYDTVCQWIAAGQWFSPGTSVSSTNKTDRYDITDI
jgi:hypothetical protein